jgi:hypothetical protein
VESRRGDRAAIAGAEDRRRYAWYFRQVPGDIDTSRCHMHDGIPLLYVGIAPEKPYADGRRSKATLHQRVTDRYTRDAEGSTLRLALGCLLSPELGIELRRVGSGNRRTSTVGGEQLLSRWDGLPPMRSSAGRHTRSRGRSRRT